MGTPFRAAAAAAALAAIAASASDSCRAQEVLAYAEGRPTIDYEAFLAAVPQFKDLSADSLELAREVNEAMVNLATAPSGSAAEKEARAAVRTLLVRYRDNKAKEIRVVDSVLRTPPPAEADLDILRKLRESELVDITWNQTKFIDCMRDIAGALGLRILLHPDVLKFNTVEVTFARAPADGTLKSLCHGFDCDYIVHDGEIVIIKTIKRNDKRLQQYLDKHPDWKFWRPDEVKEQAVDELDLDWTKHPPGETPAPAEPAEPAPATPVPAAAPAPADDVPGRPNLDNMDMRLLQRSLLKIYVCGKESTLSGNSLDRIKLALDTDGYPGREKLTQPTPEQREEMEDRHKHIFNYMLVEKTNAVQMVHIIDRILGTDVHLAGEGRAERRILDKDLVDGFEVPRGAGGKGLEVREAGRLIGEALGCAVRVEVVDTEINRVHFRIEGRTSGDAIIKQFCASTGFRYRIDDDVLVLSHPDIGRTPAKPVADEEEEGGR